MNQQEAIGHVRGETQFVDDLPEPAGLLHAALYTSPVAHGRIVRLDLEDARRVEGIRAILTADDIPGRNQIGMVIADQPLLATGTVRFIGEPLAVVVADSARKARAAAALIRANIEELPAIFDPREAAAINQLIAPPRMIDCGDVAAAWSRCAVVVDGQAETGAQEHLYLEPQSVLVIPGEDETLKIYSATQGPATVQRAVAGVLGIAMHKIDVEVARLGGGFGGKEEQATLWAAISALAAAKLRRPVKCVLDRGEDMRLTGKRHPYSCDYRMGLDGDGRILAYEATFFQNSGAVADLSTAILERSLLHASGAYRIANCRITALSCRTNLPPFTAFRGFGAPQAIFCIEAALDHAARTLGMAVSSVQERNLLKDGDTLPFGMRVERSTGQRCFSEACRRFDLPGLQRGVAVFNRQHRMLKQGLAVMPICFGISFTNTALNQASALIHIYGDGTVSLNTGAVEMGQGVRSKLLTIAATTLGIPPDLIRVETTSTGRVANSSPTAASTGSDLNGMAVLSACKQLSDRLLRCAEEVLAQPGPGLQIRDGWLLWQDGRDRLPWQTLIDLALGQRVSLTAQAHYATPNLEYDRRTEQGRPFAYHVYGTSITQATLDCRRGTHSIDMVRLVHDGGRSLDRAIDLGQIEGALVQGIGWLTMEEIRYAQGRLLTDSLSLYKIPDLAATPSIEAHFLDQADNPKAVLQSKAVGEPPFLYGIGAYFALLNAMRAYKPDGRFPYHAPLTGERIFVTLHGID